MVVVIIVVVVVVVEVVIYLFNLILMFHQQSFIYIGTGILGLNLY